MKNLGKFKLMVLLAIVAVVITGCGKKVKATDFYEIEIYGMNNYGKAKVIASQDELARAIAESAKISEDSMDGMMLIGGYMDRIKYNLEPKENLKNGDTVTLTVEYTKGSNDKVKIIGGEKKLKVKDLPEGTELDIFKDVEVNFTGVSPKGQAEVINKSEEGFVKNIYFTVEPSSNLKIGDKVTVKADFNEDAAIENMFIIKSDTKEYTVEKLDAYLDKASQFDNETKKTIIKEANDIVEAYVSKHSSYVYDRFSDKYSSIFNDGFDYKFKLNQANFLVAKNPEKISYGGGQNQLVLFYDVEVKDRKANHTGTGYAAVVFNDMILRADGKIDIVYSDGSVKTTSKRKDDIERERLTQFKDNYTIESIDLKAE